MQSSPSRITRLQRKRELVKQREIQCSICPIHGGENTNSHRRKPKRRSDRGKNHRRPKA